MLRGYKTYLAATASILGALAALAADDIELIEAIQIIVPAILAATVRHGVSNA